MKRVRVSNLSVACTNCLSGELTRSQSDHSQGSTATITAVACTSSSSANAPVANMRKALHDSFVIDVCYAAGKRLGLKTIVENNTIVMAIEPSTRPYGVMSHVYQGHVITTDGSVDQETFERFCTSLHTGVLHVDPDQINPYDLIVGDSAVSNAMNVLFNGASQCSDEEEAMYARIIARKLATVANRAILKSYVRLIEHGEIQ